MNHDPTAPRSPNAPSQAWARRAHEALRAAESDPAAILPLQPALSCPACVTACAGVISALGLGFLFTDRAPSLLLAVPLVLGVASMAWTIRAHGRRIPRLLAVAGAPPIASGRLVWSVPAAVYVGAAAFLVAGGWNLWLRLVAPRREEPAA